MSDALHPQLLARHDALEPKQKKPGRSGRPAVELRPTQSIVDTLASALERQLMALDNELASAREGDTDSVGVARSAAWRVVVILDAMKGTTAAERVTALRHRITRLRRKLDRARRIDLTIDSCLDGQNGSKLEAQRERAHEKLRLKLDARQLRKAVAAIRRQARTDETDEDGAGVRRVAASLLRQAFTKLAAHDGTKDPGRRELKKLERDMGRLLYTLELFSDLTTSAGNRLRSELAEAHGHLVELRDAEAALARRPGVGTRRRRDSLRANLAEKLVFLARAKLQHEVDDAIGVPTSPVSPTSAS